jgi:hypothetical protein
VGPSQQALAAFVAALLASFSSCFTELRARFEANPPVFNAPAPQQLSQIGPLGAVLQVPGDTVAGSLVIRLDGADVTSTFGPGPGHALIAQLQVPTVGQHTLTAEMQVGPGATAEQAEVDFQTVDLPNADHCEVLNALDCLLPYPSSRFLAPAHTATGYRLELPEGLTPSFFNFTDGRVEALSPAPYGVLDGFNPAVQVLMHFPGGVDPVQSHASRLLANTRSYDETSLQPDSPTVLLDADTGQRILHFIEVDARAVDKNTGDPLPNQIVFLRPGEHLHAGHRYIVAVRHLVHPDGSPVEPEPAFEALRDERPTTIPAVQADRLRMRRIFHDLRRAGFSSGDIGELQLAFDFVVASQGNTTGEMLSMRDQAFAWLAGQSGPTFQVDPSQSQEFDCSVPGQFLWRRVHGTFQVPLFLSVDPAADPGDVGFLQHDAAGTPHWSTLENAPFTILVPCAAQAGPVPPVVVGHGLGQTGQGILQLFVDESGDLLLGGPNDFRYLLGATDWHGMSGPDFDGVLQLQGFLGSIFSDFDNFPALPDRLRQAQANTLVLARMMRDGLFDSSPWFQRDDGSGVFPGRDQPEYYWGVSLGGIMGLFFSSLTPDVQRLAIDVGASNFSMLLSRAEPFRQFEDLLLSIAQPDVTKQAIGIQLLEELWARGEPAGYATHITGLNDPPLPGSIPKRILMTVARFDHQVSNQAAEITARTLRLPALVGSAEYGKPQIPDLPGPLDSAVEYYDPGGLVPGVDDAEIPPLADLREQVDQCDPHAETLRIPAQIDQLTAFLQPGGEISNFCDGLCNGKDADGNWLPYEIPGGAAEPCMPTP